MRVSNAARLPLLMVLLITSVISARLLTAANEADQSPDKGPAVVILRELEDAYEPVPFDHLSHAKMAEMWNGCVTCHHHSPQVSNNSAETSETVTGVICSQDDAAEIPACKSCHAINADEGDIRMPSLKGAYHRQCLNCHQEWMNENACVVCHAPKVEGVVLQHQPSPDDIVGRMHPPIPEPDVVHYRTRFTPVDGHNVVFRHMEHAEDFGIRCASCHLRDNCTNCHRPGEAPATKPLRPGMTWNESHGPCIVCHQQERCQHCHFKDDQQAPAAFEHGMTGQALDLDHAPLACAQCHLDNVFNSPPACGDASCHKNGAVEFPAQLPGMVMKMPQPATEDAESSGVASISAGGR